MENTSINLNNKSAGVSSNHICLGILAHVDAKRRSQRIKMPSLRVFRVK